MQLSVDAQQGAPADAPKKTGAPLSLVVRQLNASRTNRAMVRQPDDWRQYEQVAAHILNDVAAHFGLKRVEGKQSIPGLRSGTEWEIEAKGLSDDSQTFVIIECRRYTTSKLKQEHLGAVAYRIMDTGAAGGIIVTPLGLQEGAEKVAAAENIIPVRLSLNATPEQFALEFLGNVIVRLRGVAAKAEVGQVTVIISSGEDTNDGP